MLINKERLIADYFKANFPIKQLKYQMYQPEKKYNTIPVLVFRFIDNVSDQAYWDLKTCVEKFSGNLQWTIFINTYSKRGINKLLLPKKAAQRYIDMYEKDILVSETDYFSSEEYKELCDKAIADIPALYEHIKTNFEWKEEYTKKSE